MNDKPVNPLKEFLLRQISLGVVACFTAWHTVFRRVALRGISPVNAISDKFSIVHFGSTNLMRSVSTIATIFFHNAFSLIWFQIKAQTTNFCITSIRSIDKIKCCFSVRQSKRLVLTTVYASRFLPHASTARHQSSSHLIRVKHSFLSATVARTLYGPPRLQLFVPHNCQFTVFRSLWKTVANSCRIVLNTRQFQVFFSKCHALV